MVIPNNINKDDDKISNKPLPAMKPHSTPLSADVPAGDILPQGDELLNYVLDCIDKGSTPDEVRKQLIAHGYSPTEAEWIVSDACDFGRKTRWQEAATPSSDELGANGRKNIKIGTVLSLIGFVLGYILFGNGWPEVAGVVGVPLFLWGYIQLLHGVKQWRQS